MIHSLHCYLVHPHLGKLVPGLVGHTCSPTLMRLRQEECVKFEANLAATYMLFKPCVHSDVHMNNKIT